MTRPTIRDLADAAQVSVATVNRVLAGGGRRGELIVLGARPSMGKTSLMMDLVENAAAWSDCACLAVRMSRAACHVQRSMRTPNSLRFTALKVLPTLR